MADRKVLVIARHGKTKVDEHGHSLDELTGVADIYREMGLPLGAMLKERAINIADCLVWHSDKKRTLGTAKAALAGAYGLTAPGRDRVPQTEEDLKQIQYPELRVEPHPFLGFSHLKLSMKMLKELGEKGYMQAWIAEPGETEFYGEQNISFNWMIERGRNVYRAAATELCQGPGEKGLVFLATHGGNADTIAGGLIRDITDRPITSYDQIGGLFDKGDMAVLTFDKKGSGSGITGEYRKGDFRISF